MNNKKFIPNKFNVPKLLKTDKFKLRMLTVNDVIKDYDAVMTSVKHLRGVFGPDSKWPQNNLSLEQDLVDLGWHQKEFQNRSSFAYTMMNANENKCLGCVYILPSDNDSYDAKIILWVRESENKLDDELFYAVQKWISHKWPFKKVAYPGRIISWKKFLNQNNER